MTPDEYRATLKALGLTQIGAGRLLGVSARTAQEYASTGPSGPAALAMRLLLALPAKERAAWISLTPPHTGDKR